MRGQVDYADWLTPTRLAEEERQWAEAKLYMRYAQAIRRLSHEWPGDIRTVLEFGAGTGWVPSELDDLVLDKYVCVDRNPGCLTLAHRRNASRTAWVQIWNMDIRDLRPTEDLVCGFATLKHFNLREWQALFIRLFEGARFGLFTMPLYDSCINDGREFTHTRINEAYLAASLQRARHRELWRDTTDPTEPLIATRKEA